MPPSRPAARLTFGCWNEIQEVCWTPPSLARLLSSLLAGAADGIAAHATRGPDGLAALADVAADLVRAALGLGEGAGLVLGAAGTFEVAGFVGPAERERRTYLPVVGLMSPPSLKGISRLSPAPEAAEP
ncbi:hypothetical protein KC362_g80 [Hortaea werneckii]|nr:hypothetical protein KC362_g80 [Hortaea werneckii]